LTTVSPYRYGQRIIRRQKRQMPKALTAIVLILDFLGSASRLATSM
jgi:hypothetical protein